MVIWQENTMLHQTLEKLLTLVADKMLIINAIGFVIRGFFDYYFTFIPVLFIVLREIFITGIREQTYKINITLDVSALAKWKTTIQIIACSTFLVWRSHPIIFKSEYIQFLSFTLIWIAAFITV